MGSGGNSSFTIQQAFRGSLTFTSQVEIDYWSFIFQVNWQTGTGERGMFVKIPRNPLQKPIISQALADPLSLQMGQAEFLNLSRL
jgi:hypothetical protein